MKSIIGISLSPRKTAFAPILFSGDMHKGIQAAQKHHFSAVELSIRSVKDVRPSDLNPLLQEKGLKISALATGQACLFDELCLSSSDKIRQTAAVDHFKAITDMALQLDAGAIIIGGIRGRLSGDPQDQKFQYQSGVEAIRVCAEYTHQHGIPLLIEPINRYEMNWINSVQEGLDVLDLIQVGSVKLLLDTFHMNIEEPNMLQAFEKAGDRLGYLHFADNTRHAPGQGQIDFDVIIPVLEKIQYQGPIVSEILPFPDDFTAIKNTADFWIQRGYLL